MITFLLYNVFVYLYLKAELSMNRKEARDCAFKILFSREFTSGATACELYENEISPSVEQGLCGSIYTQLSEVEDETNGLLSYDRKVCKVEKEVFLKIATKLQRKIKAE